MTTRRPILSDALLRDALERRSAGPPRSAELLGDVLLAVDGTTQSRGWVIDLPRPSRLLVVLVGGALLAAAIVGSALVAGSRLATPVGPHGDGDIAFVQARYAWDGGKDGYGAPIPIARDQRIVRMGSDGGEPVLLARVPASIRQTLVGSSLVGPVVRWSPDGSRIAFRLLLDAPGIYVMDRDGTELTRVTDLPEPFWQSDWGQPTRDGFAWSPDGTRIAFTYPAGLDGSGGDKSSSLYVVEIRDGRLTKLAGPTASGGAFPPIAWSPDGSRIAFARSKGPLRSSTNSLVVVDADGSDEAPLVTDDVDLGGLAWSPDGSGIAFLRGGTMDGDEDGAGLWVVSPDGKDRRRIKAEPFSTEIEAVHELPLAWSPDGAWVAKLDGPGDGLITLVAPDGSGERVIGASAGGSAGIADFAWSPDGSRLVYSDSGGPASESPPTWDAPSIYVINADGTGRRWLADGEYPDWSK